MKSLFAALCSMLLVAGCSNGLTSRMMDLLTIPAPGRDDDEAQRLIAAGAPQMAVWMLDKNISVSLLQAGVRDGVTRWRALDNVQIQTRDGLIIGTRGMAFDLMTADTGGAAAVITGGGQGRINRIHRLLDGEDRLEIHAFVCDITPGPVETILLSATASGPAQRIDETCYSPRGGFANRYWLRDGRIVMAEQYLNADLGRARILFLP